MKLIESLIKEGAEKIAFTTFQELFSKALKEHSQAGCYSNYRMEDEINRAAKIAIKELLQEDEDLKALIKENLKKAVESVLGSKPTQNQNEKSI